MEPGIPGLLHVEWSEAGGGGCLCGAEQHGYFQTKCRGRFQWRSGAQQQLPFIVLSPCAPLAQKDPQEAQFLAPPVTRVSRYQHIVRLRTERSS
eukprot:2093364-Rhodomonas_salina.2